MNKAAMFPVLVLLVASIGFSQDDPTIKGPPTGRQQVQERLSTDAQEERLSLNDLEWMVGEWTDKGEQATITTNCSWTKNQSFLSRTFTITIDGQVTLEGTQMIGWDPIQRQIRSWTFDSEGGFGSGRWIRDGNRWLVKTSFVLASGERASAINIITYVDQDTLRWQSTNREIAGELQPNIPEVTVVRKKVEENTSKQSVQEDLQ